MKKILVTGGLGFIGSHLVEHLLNRGEKVYILDNKSTNVINEDFFEGKNCEVFVDSILDFDLEKLGNIDAVFHLASILGPVGVLKHSGDMGQKILDDVVKIRDFCITQKAPLIDISTSEVYGHCNVLEENSEKIFPGEYKVRTEYGAGKMLSEIAVVNKAKFNEDLNYNIIRPFNVTGIRQKPDGGFVLPRFVVAALTDQPITVYGDGSQKRAFTHVSDICDAILNVSDSGITNEIWNIGNPDNEMTIKNMAELVAKIVKEKHPEKKCKIVHVDPNTLHGKFFSESVEKVPYINKITSKVGWTGKILSEQIFEEVIDFYSERVNNGYTFKVI